MAAPGLGRSGRAEAGELDLSGTSCIVTGSNTGIGLEVAKKLSARGARVVLACRNRERGEHAARAVGGTAEFMELDLSSLHSIVSFAAEFRSRCARDAPLRVLCNNAGLNGHSIGGPSHPGSAFTGDGFHRVWQVNYLGHFLLTNLLRDELARGAPSRVVNLSSVMHHWGDTEKFSLGRVQEAGRQNAKASGMYSESKLAMAMSSSAWNARLNERGVSCVAVNPGAVDSDIWRDFPWWRRAWRVVTRVVFLSSEQAAECVVQAAVNPAYAFDAVGRKNAGRICGVEKVLTPYVTPYRIPFSGRGRSWLPFEIVGPYVRHAEATPRAEVNDLGHTEALFQTSVEQLGRFWDMNAEK